MRSDKENTCFETPAGKKQTTEKFITEYAVFARSKQSEEMIVCTTLHETSKAANREFDDLLEKGHLDYIEPESRCLKRRHAVVTYGNWEEYEMPTLGLSKSKDALPFYNFI